ncbi:MAG: DedA family protein [bacterium]|nr:DedA family protein [bacterium]
MIEQFLYHVALWLDGIHTWWIYAAIGSIAFIENIFFPFPGDVLLVFSAIYVRQGRLEFLPAYSWSILGGTLGYLCFFLILRSLVHLLERPAVKRFFPDSERLRVHAMFEKYGGWLILGNRFITGVRSMVALISAIADYPILPFIVLSSISTALYNLILFILGYSVGHSVQSIDEMIHGAQATIGRIGWIPVLITTIGLTFLTIYIYRVYKRTKESK